MEMLKKIIKKVLKKAKRARDNYVKSPISHLCYKSRYLSSLYYFFFDKSFAREQQAVLVGKVKHIKEAKKNKANYYLLVRNTHRLEKGLLMRPRKDAFGKDYISETIDSFEGIWNRKEMVSNRQMKWFHDVLHDYFTATAGDPGIMKFHERFKRKVGDPAKEDERNNSTCKSVPYHRLEEERSSITYENFYRLTRQRKSVRWFLDDPVPRELIDKAVQAAIQAPSACNRQPFEFRIFDNPNMIKEIVNYPMGTKGYGHNLPVFIVLVGHLDAYFDERDRHAIYVDASLASMSFMLALETMGLGSCAINWPDIEEREKKMEKFLKLENHQRPLMCMGLGFPDPEGMVAFSEKRPLEKIRKYNV